MIHLEAKKTSVAQYRRVYRQVGEYTTCGKESELRRALTSASWAYNSCSCPCSNCKSNALQALQINEDESVKDMKKVQDSSGIRCREQRSVPFLVAAQDNGKLCL